MLMLIGFPSRPAPGIGCGRAPGPVCGRRVILRLNSELVRTQNDRIEKLANCALRSLRALRFWHREGRRGREDFYHHRFTAAAGLGIWKKNLIPDRANINNIMSSTICIPQNEYDELLRKASLLNSIIDSENLTTEELERLKKARMGPSMTEEDFLEKHPELE